MGEQDIKLACLLASYEMDEPHVSLPDLDVGGEQFYPEVTPEKFQTWLETEHHGDCVKQPCSCIRCYAECIKHKAVWVVQKLKSNHDN